MAETGRLAAGRPGVPPPGQRPAPLSGTGPLAARAAAAAQKAPTGSLAGRSPTGSLANPLIKLVQEIRDNQEIRNRLDQLFVQFQEIDDMMTVLRCDEIGNFGMPPAQVEQQLNLVAGKIYYLKRTQAGLGPLARELSFEEAQDDSESFETFVNSMANDGAAGEPAVANKEPAPRTSVMDQLRAIMKSK